jgi:cytochrome d ubiquinol oxidase subunit I
MPIGDLDIPVLGKNVVIAVLVQTHILIATFLLGASLIAPTAEYLGMVMKQKNYERFARSLARFIVLLFASGSALAIAFVFALVILFPIFFSYLILLRVNQVDYIAPVHPLVEPHGGGPLLDELH